MKRFAMIFVVVLATLHIMTPKPVAACTPTPEGYPPYTLDTQVQFTEVILEGTVLSVSGENYDQTATVQVQQYLKGDGPVQVTINNFGSSSMCLTTVSVGDHLIFFASGDPATGLRASYMSAGAAIKGATAENIAAIRAIVEPPAANQDEIAASSSPMTRTVWAVLVSLVLLVTR